MQCQLIPQCGAARHGRGMRVNKRRWFGCKLLLLLFVVFFSFGADELTTRGPSLVQLFLFSVAPRRWLLFDFIHVGCMCCPISLWLGGLGHGSGQMHFRAQPFYSINPQMMMPKSFSFLPGMWFWQMRSLDGRPTGGSAFEIRMHRARVSSLTSDRLAYPMDTEFSILIKNTLVTMISIEWPYFVCVRSYGTHRRSDEEPAARWAEGGQTLPMQTHNTFGISATRFKSTTSSIRQKD